MQTRSMEYQQKHKQVIQYMQNHNLDAIILTRRCNFAWYTCGSMNHVSTAADVGASSIVISPEQAVCVTNTIEAPRIEDEELGELGLEVQACVWHAPEDTAKTFLAATGNSPKIACDAHVPGLPEQAALLEHDFDTLRWSLTDGEVERYRTLGQEVADTLESVCRRTRPGMSENEVAGILAGDLQERAIRAPVLLVAADDRVRLYRHPIPTSKQFERYGMAVCCGERSGLFVSCTRLFAFKNPINYDLRHRHEAVCTVDSAIIAATRPGQMLGDVFAVAQRAYAAVGFPNEWKHHHQGGSTGYLSREVKATPGNTTVVQTNQAFAWNPSIADTKSEDTILVGPEGNEILSATGNWPASEYPAGEQKWPRCDILIP